MNVRVGIGAACALAVIAGCNVAERPESSSGAATTAAATVTTVATPFGLVNAACVAEVDPSAVVTASAVPPCATPLPGPAQGGGSGAGSAPDAGADADAAADDASTDAASADASADADAAPGDDAAPVPTFAPANGWVEYADWRTNATPGLFATTWHVPDLPATDSGQTIFYFPSYEPVDGTAIVQPVLQYGVSAAGGGSYWAIASWWVGPNGARYSSLLQVNPGDTIRGTITASSCDGNGGCKFVIVTRDETLDNSRQLTVVESVPYTWTQAAVLEMYNVSACNELPVSSVTFSSFVFNDESGLPLSPTWTPEFSVPLGCPRTVTPAPDDSSVTLAY
jgi:hypothetical protein